MLQYLYASMQLLQDVSQPLLSLLLPLLLLSLLIVVNMPEMKTCCGISSSWDVDGGSRWNLGWVAHGHWVLPERDACQQTIALASVVGGAEHCEADDFPT